MSTQREETLVVFGSESPHPQFLELGGTLAFVRVDHDVLKPIFHGAPDLGWQGDHRLGVYSWPARNRFVVVRLERDGQYRIVTAINSIHMLSPADVNQLVRWLVEHDTLRGFDPLVDLDARRAATEKREEEKVAEFAGEKADRLAFELKRDLGQHMGGRRTTFAVDGRRDVT